MSDHDAAPDPMDRAYAQAEALLSDDAARAARRACVLDAVVQATAEAPRTRPSPWRRGGWAAAAGVAGIGLFLATQFHAPGAIEGTPPPTAPAVPVAAAKGGESLPPPPVSAARDPNEPRPRTSAPAKIASKPSPVRREAEPAPPSAPSPSPPSQSDVEELVVTGSRIQSPRTEPAAAVSTLPPTALAERLRLAAARGRTADVAALLARGAAADAPGDDGDTALIKAVRARHPDVAALLRRHGASPDRKNESGESARDIASAMQDADLARALDPDR